MRLCKENHTVAFFLPKMDSYEVFKIMNRDGILMKEAPSTELILPLPGQIKKLLEAAKSTGLKKCIAD